MISSHKRNLSPFASDSSGELNILRHDGDPLGVNGAKVGVFEETHQVSLSGFLERRNGTALEPQIRFELRALLVLSDLPQSHRSRPEPVRLLHSAGRRSRLASGLRRQLLTWSLATGRFTGGLLCTRHLKFSRNFWKNN
ncbi:hypothetical protein CR513_32450 [Mucuna pruriens]|uniref:Uncharacterized protein n=1 Tax=Mucuna pruriens TaxID=157652 RepID=A0A371G7B5_MUCPR|nr:hypothetical protein CR513_32450 [Mucuna pruriens]